MASTSFKSLDASEESIANITGLSYATNLITLRFYDNEIRTIPTDLPTTITTLELQDNSIRDISALSRLTSLTQLNLNNNKISNISTVSSLTNLTNLQLSDNTISNFSGLSGLTTLLNLNLRRTTISDISVFELYLGGNRITDVKEFQKFSPLPRYFYLFLDSTYTNHMSILNDPEALRAFLYVPPPPPVDTTPPVDTAPPVEADSESPRKRRIVIQECPVGWVRSDGFAGRNRRVLIYEVNLEMDMRNRVSIYKPIWVTIYVHPDEALENLNGWKLQVALPYNHHREYPLTAENSVVVDAGFVEGGFAFIENPEEDPFPMVGIGFTGAPAPGFDYCLYDETGKRVDFGISCYKRGDIF